MSAADDFNAKVIDDFRANEGRVGGMFEGRPVALLTTTSRRTGKKRTNPLMYSRHGDRVYVFASWGGAPRDPGWFRNLVADPDVELEVGTDRYPARASVVTGDERDRLFAEQAERYPQFAEYQEKTDRVIPVVALERR
jgi:deazaflavin-dependent oxidoreductase (nitroreductase family)